VALDLSMIGFALRVRPYALVTLTGVLQALAFLRLRDRPSPAGCLAVGVLTAALGYLHYTALLLVVPELAFAACRGWREGRQGRPFVTWYLASLAVAALLCVPLVHHLRYLFGARQVLGSFVEVQPVDSVYERFGLLRYYVMPLTLALVVEWMLVRPPALAGPRLLERYEFEGLVFVLLWFFLPSALVWGTTKLGLARLDLDRYVAVAAVTPILALTTTLPLLQSRVARGVALACAVGLVHSGGRHSLPALTHRLGPNLVLQDGWREADALVNDQRKEDAPVFVSTGLVEAEWLKDNAPQVLKDYLLCTVNSLYVLHARPDRLVPVRGAADIESHRRLFEPAGEFWFLERERGDADLRAEFLARVKEWTAGAAQPPEVSTWIIRRVLVARVTVPARGNPEKDRDLPRKPEGQ
jgi:hypothetical protein